MSDESPVTQMLVRSAHYARLACIAETGRPPRAFRVHPAMIELLCAERLARMLQPAPSLPNQHGAIDVLFGIPVEADETIAFADAIAVRGASLSHRIEPDNG